MDIMKKIDKYLVEEKNNDTKAEIIEFLRNNPNPEDSEIHSLSDKLKIDTHKFEAIIYSILGSFIGSGRAKEKKFDESDADKKQLALGIKIEMEHTSDPTIAKRITLDHLAEIPDYYTRLVKMEKDAGVNESSKDMSKYKCIPCGWVYDPEKHGGKPFSEWSGPCPKCGAPKSKFKKI